VPYVAPEHLERNETDARTDLFAFGCVLNEMPTGCGAFAGETAASVISADSTRTATTQAAQEPGRMRTAGATNGGPVT